MRHNNKEKWIKQTHGWWVLPFPQVVPDKKGRMSSLYHCEECDKAYSVDPNGIRIQFNYSQIPRKFQPKKTCPGCTGASVKIITI